MYNGSTALQPGKWFTCDLQFNLLFPEAIQQLSHKHWTPLNIARKAAHFLAPQPGAKVLDIGSGVGTFCLTGAHYKSNAFFAGVEQRHNLFLHAQRAKEKLGLENVNFLYGNFTRINFKQYDHFYFYNSFYENLVGNDKIDNTIGHTDGRYSYYCRNMIEKLEEMPVGTRLVTFHSLGSEIPLSYKLVLSQDDNLLKFWEKK